MVIYLGQLIALDLENILSIHSWVRKGTKNFLEAPEIENFKTLREFYLKTLSDQKIDEKLKFLSQFFF